MLKIYLLAAAVAAIAFLQFVSAMPQDIFCPPFLDPTNCYKK
ncbi:unnamed protein product [Acanthoscelides obtectus]|uniref:Uncharacterized protein n=1 Tax=Acanthoscelides obtectus TaxID=200917 RepID=A0A9P0LAN0_ACAOB|nr:unnamed protein product [Acanthoscelides obtectus]CAK1630853.1 hypothetical protein AOBTE_LOCUS6588 [Acanthoscelides obtectus]